MQRTFLRKLMTVGVTLILLSVSILSVVFIARARQNAPYVMTNQIPPLVSRARLVGPADAQQQLNLSIGLQLRNRQELDSLLSDLYNPRSPRYHRFLTPQEFAAEFGPTSDQVQQVVSYLRQQGLTVTSVAPNGLLIDANATVAQAESAFQVTINNYVLGANSFFANANPPVVPGALSSLITSVGGLDNSVKMHPLYSLSSQPHRKAKPALSTDTQNAPRAAQSGYGPSDLSGAYDATPLQQSTMQGSNQTVAVFELDGYQSSDITQYLQNYSLGTPSITNVLVDGFNGSAGPGAIEVDLDIEVVAAMAPKANQIVYEGPNSTQGVNDTYNKLVTDDKAQIATISWGQCESQSGNSELQTLDGILAQGSAEGIAMYAAAGDSGAYDCGDTNLAVDNPADDPNITGVGGTNLQLSNGAYGSESVWSNPSDTSRGPNGVGGGGGLSSFFKQPTWQTGPGVQNQYSNGNREVPDVTADADPNSGYAVYCTASASGCPSSGWIEVGGTSAAAPMWAGSTALINNYLQSQNKSRMGFANPTLYALASSQQPFPPFHDVTSGTNLYYPATAAYDEASGLGSPDIYNIARDVAAGVTAPPPSPTPNPSPTGTTTPTPSPSPTGTPSPSPTTTSTPFPSPTVTFTPVPPPTITSTPFPTPTQPGPSSNLIQNGDFEQGPGVWQESSTGGYELIDSTNPHSGNYSAYLCGYRSCDDSISQDFTVPANASSLTLDYWWFGYTNHTGLSCLDTFTVTIVDSSGKAIAQLQSACNTDAARSWQEAQYDASSLLSNYAGQTVTLVFEARTTSSRRTTSFFVDDVVVSGA
jgi:subtilase family serine protease